MAQKNTRSMISASEAQMRFDEIIEKVSVDREQMVVEKDGFPVAVILSFADYERLLQEIKLARFERRSRAAGLEAARAGLTKEQLEREMEAIRAHSHHNAYE